MKKELLNNTYVYLHRRLDTNEIFYVGIGTSKNYKRAYDSTNRNKFWKNIIKKTDYVIDIIYKNLSYNQACKYEINLIAMYGRRDLEKGNLVNLTEGGQGTARIKVSDKTKEKTAKYKTGRIFSDQTKEKMRQKALGRVWTNERKEKFSKFRKEKCNTLEYKLQRKLIMTGKKHTQETKLKISKSHKGKIISEEHLRKIREYRKKVGISKQQRINMALGHRKVILNLETGIYYFGIDEAAKSINIEKYTLGYNLRKQERNKTSFVYV